MLENNNKPKIEETEDLEKLNRKERSLLSKILIIFVASFIIAIVLAVIIFTVGIASNGHHDSCGDQTCPINLFLPFLK